MPQSLVNNLIHLIYSTKNCRPLISREIREDLNAYTGGILKNLDSQPIRINCVEDRIHLLYAQSKNYNVSEVVKELKRNTTNWMKNQGSRFQHFCWQNGYAAFSVSESSKQKVMKYINRQWEYHERVLFKEELIEFLERNEMEYDEQYLWD